MSSRFKGYALGCLAAATYGMNPLFALPLYADGLGPDDVLLLRYAVAAVALALMALWRGKSLRLSGKLVAPVAALGLLMGASSLLLFESYTYMAAGIASTLLFVYPIMVAVIMALVCKERVNALTAACLLGATAGIALLYKGSDGATLSAMGTLMVMLSALSYAIYLVWVNRPRFQAVPTITLTFYVILFGSAIFICQKLAQPPLRLPSTPAMWGCALCLGLLPTAVSLTCTTAAIQAIGSTPTAILGALEPITAVVIGVAVFGETLTPRDLLGLALILAAVTMVIAGPGPISKVVLRMRKLFPRLRHLR